jgi:deoxyribonuclease V
MVRKRRAAPLHTWDLSPGDAVELQRRLVRRVDLRPISGNVRIVAGADMAFDKPRGLAFASVVVMSFPDLEVIEESGAAGPLAFPYVPGLLSFREGPGLLAAFDKLDSRPDAVILDGQGIAHPRRLGLAAHIGLWLGIPTIGCAKSRLCGEHREPGRRKGDATPLMDGPEQIGVVLRTRTGVKPVFVSPGHLADLEGSARLVLECCTRYRLPEPTRLAHGAVGRLKARFRG